MSDEENKTRATTGVKFSAFKQVGPQEGNPVQVVGLRDGENVRANLTTDLIETNPGITFRNAKGQFAEVDAGVAELTNQLKVNRYLYDRMLESGVTIDAVPPEVYADGTFWFCNSEDSMQLFVYHEESDAWIPVAPPATISDRVAKGEEAQGAIIEAVGDLETKVSALEGAVGEHALAFSSGMTPEDGEFTITIDGMSASNTLSGGTVITMSGVDRGGNGIAIDRITEGDVLRLSDISQTTAELKITSVNGGGEFGYEKLFGDLDRLSEYPYDFNLFSSFDPQGLATIDYVDAQDEKKLDKTGGTIDGALIFQRGEKTSPQFRITPNGGSNYATSIYAMSNAQLRLRSSHTDGEVDHVGSHIIIQANDGDPVTSIYHLSHPYSDDMPVSRGYLNSTIHAPPNTGDAPTTTKLWKYCEGKSKHELGNNEFTIKFVGGDKDKLEILLSAYINGRWWVPASTINYTHTIGEVYCTISDYQGAAAIGFKGFKWWFMQKGQNSAGADKYHNCLEGNYYKHAYPDSYKLKDQHYYSLNLPSPFPLVKFPEDLHTGEAGAFEAEPEVEGVPPDAVDMGEVMP